MIDSVESLILDSERSVGAGITRPYQASAVAMNLFFLIHVYGMRDSARVAELRDRFEDAVHDADLDLLTEQVRYAITLGQAPGQLEYEELHKLLSLLDEIHALRQLGFVTDARLIESLEQATRTRFAKQRRAARMAAQDRMEQWNRELWWYAELLGPLGTGS